MWNQAAEAAVAAAAAAWEDGWDEDACHSTGLDGQMPALVYALPVLQTQLPELTRQILNQAHTHSQAPPVAFAHKWQIQISQIITYKALQLPSGKNFNISTMHK